MGASPELDDPGHAGHRKEARSGNLAVTVADESEGYALELFGELDLATTGLLEEELRAAEDSPAPSIVLDLSGLTFMDSTGLRSVLVADRRLRRSGRRLCLVRGPRAVDRVFTLTGADRGLDFLD
jgi:anti-sigma B factor antagonist